MPLELSSGLRSLPARLSCAMTDDLTALLVPVFGTFFFLLGAPALFLVSAGRWRVRRWPRFSSAVRRLEPFQERVGGVTYICADVAVFTGLGLFIAGLLAFAAWSFL